MKTFSAKVVNGRLEIADGELPDGATVTVVVPDEGDADRVDLSEEERGLLAESIRQADVGETVDARAFLRSLKR